MTTLRDATPEDVPYIDSLRKKEGSALGFIPIRVYQSVTHRLPIDGRWRHLYMRLMVTEDNEDLTGFCFVSFSGKDAKIFQIVVQEDARRWHRALLLENEVRQEAISRGKDSITCRVAFDLESNFFWRAIGYKPIDQVVSTWLNQKVSQSKRPLWKYKLELQPTLL